MRVPDIAGGYPSGHVGALPNYAHYDPHDAGIWKRTFAPSVKNFPPGGQASTGPASRVDVRGRGLPILGRMHNDASGNQ